MLTLLSFCQSVSYDSSFSREPLAIRAEPIDCILSEGQAADITYAQALIEGLDAHAHSLERWAA